MIGPWVAKPYYGTGGALLGFRVERAVLRGTEVAAYYFMEDWDVTPEGAQELALAKAAALNHGGKGD